MLSKNERTRWWSIIMLTHRFEYQLGTIETEMQSITGAEFWREANESRQRGNRRFYRRESEWRGAAGEVETVTWTEKTSAIGRRERERERDKGSGCKCNSETVRKRETKKRKEKGWASAIWIVLGYETCFSPAQFSFNFHE